MSKAQLFSNASHAYCWRLLQLPTQSLKVDTLKKDRSDPKQHAQAKRSTSSTELKANELSKKQRMMP
jgi:hypothetical protein